MTQLSFQPPPGFSPSHLPQTQTTIAPSQSLVIHLKPPMPIAVENEADNLMTELVNEVKKDVNVRETIADRLKIYAESDIKTRIGIGAEQSVRVVVLTKIVDIQARGNNVLSLENEEFRREMGPGDDLTRHELMMKQKLKTIGPSEHLIGGLKRLRKTLNDSLKTPETQSNRS